MSKPRNERYDDCFKLEMTFDGQSFYGMHEYNRDFNIHWTEIGCDDDDTWKYKIDKLTAELERRKAELKSE